MQDPLNILDRSGNLNSSTLRDSEGNWGLSGSTNLFDPPPPTSGLRFSEIIKTEVQQQPSEKNNNNAPQSNNITTSNGQQQPQKDETEERPSKVPKTQGQPSATGGNINNSNNNTGILGLTGEKVVQQTQHQLLEQQQQQQQPQQQQPPPIQQQQQTPLQQDSWAVNQAPASSTLIKLTSGDAENSYFSMIRSAENTLRTVRQSIVECMNNPPGSIGAVSGTLSTLRMMLERSLDELKALESQEFLEPKDFRTLEMIRDSIQTYLLPQLQLFEEDVEAISALAGGSGAQPIGRESCVYLGLLQEKAGPIFKEKPMGPFSLRLLTSARVHHITTGHVHPELVETSQRIKRNNQDLENAKQVFNEAGIATFNDLKFSSGTFPNLVRMKYRVQVQINLTEGRSITKTLESIPSRPFISMTNTGSQWKDAAGTWLREDAFGEAFEITIQRFWNYFQKHYLVATKQDFNSMKRPLYLRDFDYLLSAKFKQGFREKKSITQKEFALFWDWIGPGLKKIRYQKHLLWLFENGYLAAFVTGAEAEDHLKDETMGTFIIRLSERLKGEFAISYRHTEGVKHYLIQPNDTADKKKTIVDFLGQSQVFVSILQLRNDPEQGMHIFYKLSKDKVLQKYYKKPPPKPPTNLSEMNYEISLPSALPRDHHQ